MPTGFPCIDYEWNRGRKIIHYGSSRCKRVPRSVMASELHASILGFHYGFVIRDVVWQFLGIEVSP